MTAFEAHRLRAGTGPRSRAGVTISLVGGSGFAQGWGCLPELNWTFHIVSRYSLCVALVCCDRAGWWVSATFGTCTLALLPGMFGFANNLTSEIPGKDM